MASDDDAAVSDDSWIETLVVKGDAAFVKKGMTGKQLYTTYYDTMKKLDKLKLKLMKESVVNIYDIVLEDAAKALRQILMTNVV